MEKRIFPKSASGRLCVAAGFIIWISTSRAQAEFSDILTKLNVPDGAKQNNLDLQTAISGNIAILGIRYSNRADPSVLNAAYIFDVMTGEELRIITDPAAQQSDGFGGAVAISRNTAIVGAPFHDSAGDDAGAAYLFDVTTGQLLHKLTASDPEVEAVFGSSVAIDGNIALIGSQWDYDFGTSSGSAYLFDVTTGQELFKLTASDATEGDWFGSSVAISGNTAIVGASHFGINDNQPGAVYLFDVTTGQELFKLTASNPIDDDGFGTGVAIDGKIAIVGADEVRMTNATGVAYAFDVTTGQQLFKLTGSDVAPDGRFGFEVGVSGDLAIIRGGASHQRSVYLFDVTTGEQLIRLVPPYAPQETFGRAIAIHADKAVVGAFPGSAYVFDISRDSLLQGDFNTDGTVDAADYIVWRNGLGSTYTQADYNIWRANFGRSASGAVVIGLKGNESLANVPEPARVALDMVGLLSVFVARRRLRQQFVKNLAA
jgi:hypothetical protein